MSTEGTRAAASAPAAHEESMSDREPGKGAEEKHGLDWSDLEFWPESDFKVQEMSTPFGWPMEQGENEIAPGQQVASFPQPQHALLNDMNGVRALALVYASGF